MSTDKTHHDELQFEEALVLVVKGIDVSDALKVGEFDTAGAAHSILNLLEREGVALVWMAGG